MWIQSDSRPGCNKIGSELPSHFHPSTCTFLMAISSSGHELNELAPLTGNRTAPADSFLWWVPGNNSSRQNLEKYMNKN